MDIAIRNKRALVTGASSGTARALAVYLAPPLAGYVTAASIPVDGRAMAGCIGSTCAEARPPPAPVTGMGFGSATNRSLSRFANLGVCPFPMVYFTSSEVDASATRGRSAPRSR